MEHYDIVYWLGIFWGNACYIAMLLAAGRAARHSGFQKKGYMLLAAVMLAGFIVLNPFAKEIKLPGIVSGAYGMFDGGIRVALGLACTAFPFAFMWWYRFFAFNLQQHRNKNRDKSVLYVYHKFFVPFHAGLWNIGIYG